MSFVCPIAQESRFGSITIAYVEVPLDVHGVTGTTTQQDFLFDTGCEITTVSEDVAALLGLPPDDGTRRVRVRAALEKTTGGLWMSDFAFQ